MKGLQRGTQQKPIEIVQMVAFTVGGNDYALDIMRIKEIINPLTVTKVPKAPQFIEGVVELRGAILPIVDLRKRFDLPAPEPTRSTKVLIASIDVSARKMIVGLIVDGVSEPIRVPKSEVRAAPILSMGGTTYFSGMVNYLGKILMVLDIDAILSSTEKISLAGMA
jgi:purine-binding chemotaxis protein CheW